MEKKKLLGTLTGMLESVIDEESELRGELCFSNPPDPLDRGLEDTHAEHIRRLIARAEEKIVRIRRAMARIESGAFDGHCSDCGRVIPVERLASEPCTSHCADCKHLLEERYRRQHGRLPINLPA